MFLQPSFRPSNVSGPFFRPPGPTGRDPQPRWVTNSGRDTTRVGDSWGIPGGNLIRSIFGGVAPVVVVDTIRDDLTGSISGISAGTDGLLGFRPSVQFFSAERDWEIHALNVNFPIMATVGATAGPDWYQIFVSLYTAVLGFDPIEFATTTLFGPQLVTNETFNQGTVRGQGGVAATNNPLGVGHMLAFFSTRVGQQGSDVTAGGAGQVGDAYGRNYNESGTRIDLSDDKKLMNTIYFDPPLRVLRNRELTIGLQGFDPTFSYTPVHSLIATLTYTELPNPRESYRT